MVSTQIIVSQPQWHQDLTNFYRGEKENLPTGYHCSLGSEEAITALMADHIYSSGSLCLSNHILVQFQFQFKKDDLFAEASRFASKTSSPREVKKS